MSTRTGKARAARQPRVLVSRSEHLQAKASRTVPDIHRRLLAGARKIVVDTGTETIDLTDSDFADAGQDWALRITGSSNVRIHLSTPLPHNAQIVATDASFVEVQGHVTIHAYGHSTVHAFDKCTVYGRNHAVVSACDSATVLAVEDSVISAYDTAHVRASGRARVAASDRTSVYLDDDARAEVQRGVIVTGPARANLAVRR